ncbi:hypothetical protein Q9R46_07680 [Paenibacillus sp. RRE4]|uniref:hypothetical protein n=1 Tax=Paenibacillus sp. RRE4 TaxID=2962587 RepID=UPI002881906E|nr:hypothetical protein [Paenibacillus sp. RRE4]MDT0122514.1 hypothetical protein [Paenibacillus sp. RRE4]
MKKNRVLTLLVSSIFILSVVGCSPVTPAASPPGTPVTIIASEDYPTYGSVDALSQRADTIVKGNVIQTRVEALDDRVSPESQDQHNMDATGSAADAQVSFDKIYTIYTVQVTESYKGGYTAGDRLEVKQLGGQLGNTEIVNDDSLKLMQTKDYVLFLETYEDTPASLLNSVQSLYVVKPASKSNQASQQSQSEVIVSANPENDLTLSLSELQQIKNEQSNP